jgi:hypothetical protein
MPMQINPPVKTSKVRPDNKLTTPVRISSASKSSTVATIVFNQPAALKGIPAWTTDIVGVHTTAATMTSPTTLSLTFSASIATATTLNIPVQDPSIRNAVGGFVADTSFPLS